MSTGIGITFLISPDCSQLAGGAAFEAVLNFRAGGAPFEMGVEPPGGPSVTPRDGGVDFGCWDRLRA